MSFKKKYKFVQSVLISALFVLTWIQAARAGVFTYIINIFQKSTFIEENYVEPNEVSITFPEKKKNLIYIYMESVETTLQDKVDSTGKHINYIPNLTELQSNNISFNKSSGNGGFDFSYGTEFTMGALLGSTSGVPFLLPIEHNSASLFTEFLPRLTTLGEILDTNGYSNYFVCGSKANFGGRELYFETHGNYIVLDVYSIYKEGFIEDINGFWGVDDCDLFAYAKSKLTEISTNNEPFNFSLLTVDTHYPDGYICRKCSNEYPEKYANSYACSDRQVVEFINWLKEQPWYSNTVVIVAGDHESMNVDFFEGCENRGVYNCILNCDTEIENDYEYRTFTILDMFPTTLAAIGVDIEGNKLGFGVNLFSKEKTLPEKVGLDEFNRQLSMTSDFYIDTFVHNEKGVQ